MKKRIIILLIMILFATSCQTDRGTEESEEVLQESTEKKTVQIKENIDITKAIETLSKGVNQFSFKLYDELENEENMCISPYSMVSVLSMLDNGADGNTKKEIEKALGIEDIATQNRALQRYVEIQKQKSKKFYQANSVWVSENTLLDENSEKNFFQPLQQYFNADKFYQQLDTVDTMNQLNKWVSKETKGMLDKLIIEPLDPETKILFLNALYFQGEWQNSFVYKGERMEFHGNKEDSMVSKMLLEKISLKYIEKYGLKGVEIPYKDGTFAMDLFLSEQEEKNAISIFKNMNQKEKNNLFEEFDNVKKQQIQITMPKFTIEYNADSKQMISALKEIGITDAFVRTDADFSKVSTKDSFYIDRILHKTKIEVEEKGTKAAAVTSVKMSNGCKVVEGLRFIVNQPFLYTIRDTDTDMILFIGSVQDFGVQSFPGHIIEEK